VGDCLLLGVGKREMSALAAESRGSHKAGTLPR
jgi:hypothetical protein